MDFLTAIFEDKEICEMQDFLEKETGHIPGFGFWDAETFEGYRERLRKKVEEVKKEKSEKK